MFTQAGVFTATLTHTTEDGTFDGFIVKFDGSVTPIGTWIRSAPAGDLNRQPDHQTSRSATCWSCALYEQDGFCSTAQDQTW